MERETKTIRTPRGNEIVVHSYLTGREQRQIRGVFLHGVEITSAGQDGKAEFKNLKADQIEEAENMLLRILVVFLNGSIENVADRILDLPADEYEYIRKEINAISGDFLGEGKK